ncbi:MAG: hypothetical protein LBH80_04725 [Prevotellaceae bacterium]|jgi:hypothetical protein|nr:hypothetical protein [Prevotellaceae bacterium]
MKKVYFLVALVAFTLTSCDKNEFEQTINPKNEFEQTINQEEVKFGGFKVNLPPNYNEKVLSLSLSDLQNQFYTNNTGGLMRAKSSESAGITLDEMSRIIDGILINYPNLDSLTTDEIEKIKINFPDLSSDEIVENINVVDSFYTSLVRYDLVQELTKTESKSNTGAFKVSSSSSSDDYLGSGVNTLEFWYLVWHPALVSPIRKASDKADSLTKSNYPESKRVSDKADAFRHALWNVLICKYIGEDKNKNAISDCTERAEDFTNRHVTGAEKPSSMTDAFWELDKKMDLHNNIQGRKYFESVAWIEKVGVFKVKRVRAPSEDVIVIAIKNKVNSARKISTLSDTSKYPNNLVYIID